MFVLASGLGFWAFKGMLTRGNVELKNSPFKQFKSTHTGDRWCPFNTQCRWYEQRPQSSHQPNFSSSLSANRSSMLHNPNTPEIGFAELQSLRAYLRDKQTFRLFSFHAMRIEMDCRSGISKRNLTHEPGDLLGRARPQEGTCKQFYRGISSVLAERVGVTFRSRETYSELRPAISIVSTQLHRVLITNSFSNIELLPNLSLEPRIITSFSPALTTISHHAVESGMGEGPQTLRASRL